MPTMLASVPQNALPTTACGPVLVRERDMRRLSTLLETSLNCRYPKESARLSEVLRAAIVVADDAIAVGTVTMGAQVFCEDQDGLRSWDERPASFVGVYSFTWQVSSWCGEQATGSRQGLTFAKVKLPAMHTGEVLELWIDGVDLERAWGALLFDTDDEMNKYTVSLTEAGSAWQKIPSEYTSVAVESGRGVSECDITRECCAC